MVKTILQEDHSSGGQDGDAEAGVVGQSCFQEADGAFLLLAGQDLAEGDARGIVDADMDELPADAIGASSLAITGDAVAGGLEPAELLAAEVDELAAGVLRS